MKHGTQSGYIAITSVIIICAVALIILSAVSLLGIGETQSGFASVRGNTSFYLAEGCMEHALLQARNNNGYTGGTLTMPEGVCTITVSKSGTAWTITALVPYQGHTQTVQTDIERTGTVTIQNWRQL